MMDFMVIGLARSGTTWAANWLTSSGAICYHDPMMSMTLEDLLRKEMDRPWGVSCTALWKLGDDTLKALSGRRLIITRAEIDRRKSCATLGVDPSGDLSAISGLKIDYNDLFNTETARQAWKYLRPDARFDEERHKLLCEMNIQPALARVPMTRTAVLDFVHKTRRIACSDQF